MYISIYVCIDTSMYIYLINICTIHSLIHSYMHICMDIFICMYMLYIYIYYKIDITKTKSYCFSTGLLNDV